MLCHRYWPDENAQSEMHGQFEIVLHSTKDCFDSDYVLREIKIVDTKVKYFIAQNYDFF